MDSIDSKNLETRLKFISIKKNEIEVDLREIKSSYSKLLSQQSVIKNRIKSISFNSSQNPNIAYLESFKLRNQLNTLGFKVKTMGLKCRKLEAKKSNLESICDKVNAEIRKNKSISCLLYTSPSPRDATLSRMPSSA